MKNVFTTKNIAGMAVFAALAYIISFLEIPLFPAASFLKLDFSNVFIMLAGFMYGPLPAVLVGAVKELLCLIGTSSSGVGQIANMLVICAFVLPPSITYLFKKGLKWVIITLSFSCLLQTAVALLVNKFITFPIYSQIFSMPVDYFNEVVWLIIGFNLIKSVSVSVITILLYKKVSYIFKKINLQNSSK